MMYKNHRGLKNEKKVYANHITDSDYFICSFGIGSKNTNDEL